MHHVPLSAPEHVQTRPEKKVDVIADMERRILEWLSVEKEKETSAKARAVHRESRDRDWLLFLSVLPRWNFVLIDFEVCLRSPIRWMSLLHLRVAHVGDSENDWKC